VFIINIIDLNKKLKEKKLKKDFNKIKAFSVNHSDLCEVYGDFAGARDNIFFSMFQSIIDEVETFNENDEQIKDEFAYSLIYHNLLAALDLFINTNNLFVLENDLKITKENMNDIINKFDKENVDDFVKKQIMLLKDAFSLLNKLKAE